MEVNVKKDAIINFFKGMFIGGTMTVPGISGGSMAMILGIYERMISSVNKAVKLDKKSILFLLECLVGALVGVFLFSNSLLWLLDRFEMPMRYFFVGVVAGGTPLIYRSAHVKKVRASTFLYPLLGIALVLLIALLPNGVFAPSESLDVKSFFIQLLGGLIVAVAFVLPGISVSQMLWMLGLYEIVMSAIGTLNILPIIPLGIGVLIGTLATAKGMDKAMHAYPEATYLIILGFVLGSLKELFPGVPTLAELPICAIMAIIGFFALYFVSSKTFDSSL